MELHRSELKLREFSQIEVSVICPMFNEEGCVVESLSRVVSSLKTITSHFEVIAVDDCSTDNTLEKLKTAKQYYPELKIIKLSKNSGQTAALYAGIQNSCGEYVVIMDSDLQHAPEEIPDFIHKIKDGFDLVSGKRVKRNEPFLSRRLQSLVANFLIRKATGCTVKDMVGFKCLRGDLARSLNLRAGYHRLLPAIIYQMGGNVTEIDISSPKRFSGESSYGTVSRTLDVFIDIILLLFRGSFKSRPLYFFGRLGLIVGTIGASLLAWAFFDKIFYDIHMGTRPIFIFSIFFFLVSLGVISFGFILELVSDTLDRVGNLKPYIIDKKESDLEL